MDRFIVGTGRCGSTLLSRMIAEHPATLSIFEFFNGLDMTRRFSPEAVSGEEFVALFSQEHPFLTMVLKRGYEVEEVTYPFGPNARFSREDGVPWILVSMLPRLTDDPDALFDEAVTFASGLPQQELSLHYRQLFEWLGERLGRPSWIERSGSSIDYLGSLHKLYPQARFLHIHRDGHETALSMREHAAYRLAISLLYQLPTDTALSIDELGEIDPGKASDATDSITQMIESRPPVENFGRYWSQELVNGLRALAALNEDQYMEVRFEQLIAKPQDVLRDISDFFDLGDHDGWTGRASALIRGVPPTRFDKLPQDEQERLAETCKAGMQLLGRSA